MSPEQRYQKSLRRAADIRDRRILEEDARYSVTFDQHRTALQAIRDDFEAERAALAEELMAAEDADPSGEEAPVFKTLRELVALHDRNTCLHEETKRGGTNWTICTQCDRKWADDEGGMPKPVDPPEVAAARRILGLPRPF